MHEPSSHIKDLDLSRNESLWSNLKWREVDGGHKNGDVHFDVETMEAYKQKGLSVEIIEGF